MPRNPRVLATQKLTTAQANDTKARATVKKTRASVIAAAKYASDKGLSPTEIGRILGVSRQGVNHMLSQ